GCVVQSDAVPVDRGGLGQAVLERDAQQVAGCGADQRPGEALTVCPGRDRLPSEVHGRRRRGEGLGDDVLTGFRRQGRRRCEGPRLSRGGAVAACRECQRCCAETSGEHGTAGNTLHRCSPSGGGVVSWPKGVQDLSSPLVELDGRDLSSSETQGEFPDRLVLVPSASWAPGQHGACQQQCRGPEENQETSDHRPYQPRHRIGRRHRGSPWWIEYGRDTVPTRFPGAGEVLVESSSRSGPDSPPAPP